MRKIISSLFLSFFLLNAFSQTTINTMFYNVLEFPEAPPSNRATILKSILESYQPDLFMVCELQSQDGATTILNTSLQTSDQRYEMAQFVSNQSNPNTHLQQLVFFNKHKLVLNNQNSITTNIRDINHYTFVLNSSDNIANPIYLDVFVTHLKSSQGAANEQQRFDMVKKFTDALTNIPSNHFVIFSGDLNIYSSNENAYQELLDPTNSIVLKDPIDKPGGWHNNTTYQNIHTQSTRISSANFNGHGAGGGLDDRFDFILISESLRNNNTLHYVENSYKSFGNNGNCFNKKISDNLCTGEFSQEIRDNLYNMSDHLPVVLQLESNLTLSITEHQQKKSNIRFSHGNLVSDTIELDINSEFLETTLFIYNSMGQLIDTIHLTQTHTLIDATYLPNGIYYILLQSNAQHNPLKFIKL